MAVYNLVDPSMELIDPSPDIFSLFMQFNDRFFYGELGSCVVEWNKKMTTYLLIKKCFLFFSCAGVCSFHFGTGLCSIRLSEPLLKLRPRKDLIETMLHEMIHAYLFITKRLKDREGHGPEFQAHMYRINKMASTNITIYHSFHAEVAHYKQKAVMPKSSTSASKQKSTATKQRNTSKKQTSANPSIISNTVFKKPTFPGRGNLILNI